MRDYDKSNQLLQSCRRDSGSALITAVIFSFVVGMLSLAYLKMASTEYRAALRSTLYASSLNLAESGVEMGIAELNGGTVSGSTWSDDTIGSDFLSDAGFRGDVRYVIKDANLLTPTIIAEGRVFNDSMAAVTKQVKVRLSRGFQPFEKGFSSRNGITFSGSGVYVDSYNSNYGEYDEDVNAEGAAVGYGVGGKNKNDDITVASQLLDESGGVSVSVGNGTIYGFVQTGGDSQASVKKNGMVTTYVDTDEGGIAGQHQGDRILGDFYADFPVEEQPSGVYDSTYSTIKSMTTITGSSSAEYPTYYDVSEISLSGAGDDLIISGHVVLVLSGDISVTGKGGITLDHSANSDETKEDRGSSLAIYSAQDIAIAGNGVTNDGGAPSDFKVYGTAAMDADGVSAGQDIQIAGNGQLSAAVYAPNADVTLNGGGTDGAVLGGVVALTATITGGNAFHFDEALRGIIEGDGRYTVSSWLEMTGATPESKPIDLSTYF